MGILGNLRKNFEREMDDEREMDEVDFEVSLKQI